MHRKLTPEQAIAILAREDVCSFIQDNLSTDTSRLLLNPPQEFRDSIQLVADQIIARKKSKKKIPDWFANPDLIFPPPLSIEQASSSTTSLYKKGIYSGEILIDLTGGAGVDFLALSDNFKRCVYVDDNPYLGALIEYNSKHLEKKIEVVSSDSENYISTLTGTNYHFFIDPARRDKAAARVFRIEDSSPNLLHLLPDFQRLKALVLIKLSPLLEIHSILSAFPSVQAIHVVSIKNECKEILVHLDFNKKSANKPHIYCVNLETKHEDFQFDLDQEKVTSLSYNLTQKYVYEPNSSIMKAGGFKSIGKHFQLAKLAPNTHFYTSDILYQRFPGKVFKILASFREERIEQFAEKRHINVISRNHPMNATAIKKKYRLKDGGSDFLLAFRDYTGSAKMYFASLA
ncbi:MAG: hypothetical protein AAF789_00750 [Bacteroidota bacterium]